MKLIDVEVQKMPKSKVKLLIAVSPEEMKKHFDHAYSHVAEDVKIQGFRPGKAPRSMVEASVGITKILSEAIDMAVNESYIKALKENNLSPISQPSIKINKYPSYGQTEEEIKDNLEFEMEFMVFPETTLGDYNSLKVELPKKEIAAESDVQKVLDNLQKQKAQFSEIDREAKIGDLAELNFDGSIKSVKIDAMSSKNHPVVLGEKTLIPGFEEEIVGMKKGGEKDFKIKFPKDYHNKEFAGKEASFHVELVNLKEVKLPEIDDKFAADFGQSNAEDLKKAIFENIQMEMDKKYRDELENMVLDKVLPLIKADIPDEMIDREVDRMISSYQKQLSGMGINFDTYLQSMKKSHDEIKKEMRPTAEKNIKVGLLLGKVVEELKLDPNNQESGKKAVEHLVQRLTK